MKIKITSNLNDFERKLKKEIEKVAKREEFMVRTQNQAFMLDDECEMLLLKILNSKNPFPQDLQKMFYDESGNEIPYDKEKILRAQIHELVVNGLITLNWGDGLPIFGRIEQKGRTYFEMKNKYLQQLNNGVNMQFKILDKESESYLKELVSNPEFLIKPIHFENKENNEGALILENLIANGYLDSEGVSYNLDNSGYVCVGRLTQSAKTYDELKEKFEKMSNNKTYYNYGIHNDLSGSNFENSNVMVGNTNSNQDIKITNELVDDIVNTTTRNIEEYGLSDENKQELKELIEDVKEKQTKKPSLVKRGLKTIWNFAKEVGCQVLAAYIATKCGF